jgi:membrane-associated phospholipid phosphatase
LTAKPRIDRSVNLAHCGSLAHTLQHKVLCRHAHDAASARSTWLIAASAAACLVVPLTSRAQPPDQEQGCVLPYGGSAQRSDEQQSDAPPFDQPQADAQSGARSDVQSGPQSAAPSDQQSDGQPNALPNCPTPLARALGAVKAYVTAPARWDRTDWLYFGGSVAAIGVASHFDSAVRTYFADHSPVSVNSGSPDSLKDALPAAALFLGTWGYANLIDDEDGRREAHAMAEASTLSLGTAIALSYITGRERPNQTTSPGHWRASGTSFPSEHSTAAFAIGTVLAESGNPRYRWIRRVLGYGVAGFTVYERLNHNAHWLSDTVAGAALGAASARFAMNREREAEPHGSLTLEPINRGVMMSYTVKLR